MKYLRAFLALIMCSVFLLDAVSAEEPPSLPPEGTIGGIVIEDITAESAYLLNVSTYNPNTKGITAEALVIFWPGDSAGKGVNAQEVYIRPGNGSVMVYAPKQTSTDKNASKYEIWLRDENRTTFASKDFVPPPQRPKNLEYVFFLIAAVLGAIVGGIVGNGRGYAKCYRDMKAEEVLRNKEKQK